MSLYSSQLMEQARRLATSEGRGRPRQASLRRATSTAYYGLFHFLIDQACRSWVSGEQASRRAIRGTLARAFDHTGMRKAAASFAGGTLPARLAAGLAGEGVPVELRDVAETFRDLQEGRHQADYNLLVSLQRRDVLILVDRASDAVQGWDRVRESTAARLFLVALLVNDRIRE